MRVVVTLPDEQLERIDHVAERLGIKRSDAIRFLLTYGLTHEQFRAASTDSARASLIVADMAAREMSAEFLMGEGPGEDRVLVTPGLGSKVKHGRGGESDD